MSAAIKILHTGDLHLGARFIQLGSKGKEHRHCLRAVLGTIADLAIQEQVDALLIAGDLFDTNQPSPESRQAFSAFLRRLEPAGIPVVAIAGTHDHLGLHSVLPEIALQHPSLFYLLGPEKSEWIQPEKGLRIQGISQLTADHPLRPVRELKRQGEWPWQIGMAHASIDQGRAATREAIVDLGDITSTQLDYLALGHWHQRQAVSEGRTVSWYAGSPELVTFDEGGPGAVLIITFKPGLPVQVEERIVGSKTVARLQVPVGELSHLEETAKKIASPDRIADLVIEGVVTPGHEPDVESIRRLLGDQFYFLRIRDASVPEWSDEELDSYPVNSVLGRLIRLAREEISQSKESEREILQQALQLSIALLLGREVAPWS